jgi:apolipoprotein D and lipocalin family protein
MRKSHLIVSVLLVFLTVSILPAKPSKIETVKNIDLDRYTGTWYEIARMPNKHENGLVRLPYSQEMGKII